MAKKKKSEICIVTVVGRDQVGIIAKLSNAMAKADINIVDVTQKIMKDIFVMTMACDMVHASIGFDQIQKKLNKLAGEMGLKITFQHEDIFKTMHRI